MSETERSSTDTDLTDSQAIDAKDTVHSADQSGTVERVTTATGSAQHDTVDSAGTPSADRQDDVTDGKDGYEYHTATANDHELHGSDVRDSVLVGAPDDDKLVGGSRNDVLDGGDGNNTLDGGSGDDVLVAGGATNRGDNHLNGGSGDDILVAGGTKTHTLDDFLKTNPALSTTINGDAKYASLSTLVKGATDDSGGGAVNIFELQSGNGHDSIFNFHASSDKLEIHRGLNGSDIQDTASLLSHIHVSGNDLSIDLGNGNSVTLVGVDVEHLTQANLAWIG